MTISLANLAADDFEAVLFGLLQAGIDLALQEGFFAEELAPAFEAPWIKRSGFHGGGNGAAGFAFVAAIAEAAARGERFDFRKCFADGLLAGGPELKFAKAGGINEQGAAGQREEFTRSGGMAAAAVGFACGLGWLHGFAEEPVEQRGFADAG